jgi:hypothetical protein
VIVNLKAMYNVLLNSLQVSCAAVELPVHKLLADTVQTIMRFTAFPFHTVLADILVAKLRVLQILRGL